MSTVSVLESEQSDQLAALTCSIVECAVVYCKCVLLSLRLQQCTVLSTTTHKMSITIQFTAFSDKRHRSSSYLLSAKHAYGNILRQRARSDSNTYYFHMKGANCVDYKVQF